MKVCLQAVVVIGLGLAPFVCAEAPKPAFRWDPPKVTQSMFSKDVGMLDSEREEYATNLAIFASNQIAEQKAASQSLADARKILALAFHLSPRNKRAVVLSFQLSKGMVPDVVQGNYSPTVLARLLLTRGQLLDKQGGEENKKLARYFIQLAADMDPKHDDAVYAAEVQRLDHGAVDWLALITPPAKPAAAPEGGKPEAPAKPATSETPEP